MCVTAHVGYLMREERFTLMLEHWFTCPNPLPLTQAVQSPRAYWRSSLAGYAASLAQPFHHPLVCFRRVPRGGIVVATDGKLRQIPQHLNLFLASIAISFGALQYCCHCRQEPDERVNRMKFRMIGNWGKKGENVNGKFKNLRQRPQSPTKKNKK